MRRLEAHELAFLALVFSVPFMWPLHTRVLGQAVILTDGLYVIAVLAAGRALWTRRLKLKLGPFVFALIPYVGTTVLATVTSEDPTRSTAKLIGELYLFGIGLLTYTIVTTRSHLVRVFRVWTSATALSVAGVAVGLIAFALGARDPHTNPILSDLGTLPPGPYPRVQAFFLNNNMACTYLIVGFCVVSALTPLGLLRLRRAALLVVAIAIAAALTLSPALGGLAIAVGTVSWQVLRAGGYRITGMLVAAGAGLVAVAMLVLTAAYPSRSTLTGTGPVDLEPSSRWRAWQSALATVSEHPWSGRGLGLQVADVRYTTFSGVEKHFTDAHNVWLNIAAQQGVLGLGAFAGFVGFLAWRNRGGNHERPLAGLHASRPALLLALVAGFLYPSLSGSFEDTRHMWLLMGLLGATADARHESPHLTAHRER